ncbi:flagellin [uncultured Cohaesibacter sp.]|uniref:flagellin n=1 Tax=uncultured Cohaesibacter sp. TaxID=1002546 RepID=UPI00292DD43D|nr:flagellin [uncultured Cohaesibacter sp.]
MAMRVATFHTTSSLLDRTLTTQARLANIQKQESTGLVSTDYAGLGSEAGSVISLSASISTAESNISAAETVISRSDTIASVLQDITDLLTNARSSVSATSTSDELQDLQTSAAEYLEDLELLLNTQYQGRYIFSGSLTDTEPVDTSSYEATDLTTVNTDYYQGDSYTQVIRLDSGTQVEYGVTATLEGIEEAMRALSYLANSITLTTSELDDVDDLLVDAQDAIITATSAAGTVSSRLETYIENEEDYIAQMEDLATDATSIDIAAAAVEATTYETMLEASYSALSTIINLSLVDYL